MKPEVAAAIAGAVRKNKARSDRAEHPVAFYDVKSGELPATVLCDAPADPSRGKRLSTILRPVHSAPAPVASTDCGLKAKVHCLGCGSKLCLNHARTLTDMGGKNPGKAGHRKCSVCGFTAPDFPTLRV